jgi:enolase-phosphatase E1
VTLPPAAIVTDIEGTTTRVAFVHDVLFAYARENLESFLAKHAGDQAVATVLAEVNRIAPGVSALQQLRDWMTVDAKVTPLKTLQGLIWAERRAAQRGLPRRGAGDARLARRRRAPLCLFVRLRGSAEAIILAFAGRRCDRPVQRIFRYHGWRQA